MVFSRVKQVTDSREADINYRFVNEKQPNNTKKQYVQSRHTAPVVPELRQV